jgi:hypothetical protein
MQQGLQLCLEIVVVRKLVHHLAIVVAEQQHNALNTGLEPLHVTVTAVHNSVTDGLLLLQEHHALANSDKDAVIGPIAFNARIARNLESSVKQQFQILGLAQCGSTSVVLSNSGI